MNQNSQMTRWTQPTRGDFYALHKSAIGIYGTTVVIVQCIWLAFSVNPLAHLLEGGVPSLAAYALPIAFTLLIFLHYVLHELLRYVFFNLLDDDPNTVNAFMHYAVIAAITVGMFVLDLQGTTRFLRKADDFKAERTAEQTAHRSDFDKVTSRQSGELATLQSTHKEEIQAVFERFSAPLRAIKNRKCYDEFDAKKRSRDYETKAAEMNAAVAAVKSKYADIERATLSQHTTERNRMTTNVDTRTASIDAADSQNAEKSESYGWGVSLLCLLVLLGCTYQSTYLRVKSGQKPVSRFTIADATGSTTSKAADVVNDIWQRKTHQWLAQFHGWATSETRELDSLDGAFKLKGGKYEVPTGNNGGNSATQPPPPIDPNGGNGGGGSNPPAPPFSPPTNGNTQAAPISVQPTVNVAERTCKFHNLVNDDMLDFLNYYAKEPYLYKQNLMFEVCQNINPTLHFVFDKYWILKEDIEAVCKAVTRKDLEIQFPNNPPPLPPSDFPRIKIAMPQVEPDADDEERKDVYTAYIRGYVETEDSTWRNPTQFITLLRNAYNRGYDKKIELRRLQLARHLDDKHITAEIISFCRKNQNIIGDVVFAKFQQVLGEEVKND